MKIKFSWLILVVLLMALVSPTFAQDEGQKACPYVDPDGKVLDLPNGTLNAKFETVCVGGEWIPVVQPQQQPGGEATAEDMPEVFGEWEIQKIDLNNDPIVAAWLERLQVPAPELWPTFPNVPNPLVPDFRVVNGNEVPDGLEYGEDDSPFCEQDQRCDWVVPSWHYRLITGDYKFHSDAFSYECVNTDPDNRRGCLIALFNVGGETYTWRDQSVDNGFTVFGRYWNGDALEWGVWGLVSHASANMLNMPTMGDGGVLNAGGASSNAGSNCSVPGGCNSVDATVVVHAGDRILAVAQTTITK